MPERQSSHFHSYLTDRLQLRLLSLILIFVAATATSATFAQQQNEQKVRQEIRKLQLLLKQQKAEERQIRFRLAEVNRLSAKNKKQRQELETVIQSSDEKLAVIRQTAEIVSDKLQGQKNKIAELMKMMHRHGPGRDFQAFLRPEQPRQFVRMQSYFKAIKDKRDYYVNRYREDLQQSTRLEQEELRLSEEQRNRHRQLNEQELVRAQLREEHRATLSMLNQNIELTRQELTVLLEYLETLPKQLVTPSRPFSSMRKKLLPPVNGSKLHNFGEDRIDRQLKWSGIVFSADSGEEVKAIHDGKIIFADEFGRYGFLLVIDHGDNYTSVYGYNEALLREQHDQVTARQPISIVGSGPDGISNQLYFEIRHRNRAINPAIFLYR